MNIYVVFVMVRYLPIRDIAVLMCICMRSKHFFGG